MKKLLLLLLSVLTISCNEVSMLENPFKWKPTVCNCYEFYEEVGEIKKIQEEGRFSFKMFFMSSEDKQDIKSKNSDCYDLAREIGIENGNWQQHQDFKECN